MEDKLFYFLDPFGPSRTVRGAFSALKLVPTKLHAVATYIATTHLYDWYYNRRYFKDRSSQIGQDRIDLNGYQIVQLQKCIQFDGVNCGVICLKVFT